MDCRHHRLLRLVSFKMRKNVIKINLQLIYAMFSEPVTSNIGLLEMLHKGYPECSRYMPTFICIHSTQSVVTVMFLDFQGLPYFPCEFIVNYGYCTGFIELDFTRAVFAVKSHGRFVEFFFIYIRFVLLKPSVDSLLSLATIWGYAARAWYLVYTRVAILW